jgi:hypothetical protein
MDNNWTRFDERFGLGPLSDASPIFVLAAGWRSGSTLLQRLVCSSGEALIWGEPYGRTGLVPAMTRATITLRSSWPAEESMAPREGLEGLSEGWIANLYPEPEALKRSCLAQLETLLAEPARARGFTRWGFKEVRLQRMDANYLAWLYPNARFLFQVRNPWDAWASAKGGKWYLRWPDQVVTSAAQFGQHWRKLVESFLAWPDDRGMLVRYEDLVKPSFDLEQIREHCDLTSVDASVRDKVIRGLESQPTALTRLEIEQIRSCAGEWAEVCGYAGPSQEPAGSLLLPG